ncbi:DUF4232 domain-containing protein [Streptomyces sp. Z26]|uniref:DUF4232 domain-containing protein n=1 Tax=Streptomyces sp. Z26 TaxID=2500177 RepID=UPI000EF161F5|nr:DUF4232 domain-containing protein [Streptomyces sp. Z26]RLL66305.1 DUF4232 domain-containing protein [Streptomyces sp. Z26]
MKSPDEPPRGAHGGGPGDPPSEPGPDTPSEIRDAFTVHAAPLPAPPGAFGEIRRAAARRRRRRVAVCGAVLTTSCVALGVVFAQQWTPPTEDGRGPAATADTLPTPSDTSGSTVGGTPDRSPDPSPSSPAAPTKPTRTAPPDRGAPSPSRTGSASGGAEGDDPGRTECASADVGLEVAGSEQAAGSRYVTVRLTSTRTTPCTITGYPDVVPVTASGRTVGNGADHVASDVRAVTLEAGATARFVLKAANPDNYDRETCDPAPAAALRVAWPGSEGSDRLPVEGLRTCRSDEVTSTHVTAVEPGA